ncbi:MAG: SMP-30/gluconolactonase/LRE family protein [Pirellula sp.]
MPFSSLRVTSLLLAGGRFLAHIQATTRCVPAVTILCLLGLMGWIGGNARCWAQERPQPALPGVGKVQKLHDGFQFTEGPAYDGAKYLYFTDIPNNRILRTDVSKLPERVGELEVFLEDSRSCNGLMFDGRGTLIGCQMKGSVVAWDVATKKLRTLTDRFSDRPYNACNDLVVDRSGGIYFTDPRYAAPDPWPQKIEAFYYRAPDGEVTRLGEDILAPNGIILSPDEKTLYVVPSMQKQVMAYPVISPGKLGRGRVLFEMKQPDGKTDSGGDGLSVDTQGNLYITTDLGVQCVSPEGTLLGIIPFPEIPANCAFGGPDNKFLFATCRTGLYAVAMPIAGHVFRGVVP